MFLRCKHSQVVHWIAFEKDGPWDKKG